MADWVTADKTQLAATLLTSAVHSLRSQCHSGSSNDSMGLNSLWADQIMARFDLERFTEDSINALVPSTINYAARMTQYRMSQWIDIDLESIIGMLSTETTQIDLALRVAELLVHASPESVKALHVCLFRASNYCDVASQLNNLDVLELGCHPLVPVTESEVEDVLRIISRYEKSFPGRPLNIELDVSWEKNWMELRNLTSEEKAHIWTTRSSAKKRIYQSLTTPEYLDVTEIDDVYRISHDKDLSHLSQLVDHNINRADGSLATLVRDSPNLKELYVAVEDPMAFQWKVNSNQEMDSFPRLEVLDVACYGNFLVFNQAVHRFGKTLVFARLGAYMNFSPAQKHRIQTVAAATPGHETIGGWDLPLVERLDVDCQDLHAVKIGSFTTPNLKRLTMRICGRLASPTQLSAQWNLPRLCFLELHEAAALIFDFDSLSTMPCLEELILISSDQGHHKPPVIRIPRLSQYAPFLKVEGAKKTAPRTNIWREDWDLPRLKKLKLQGTPSSAFSMKWLVGCPALEELTLITHGKFQRLPISSTSWTASTIHPIPLKPLEPKHMYDWTTSTESISKQDSPLLESKLVQFKLEGPWVMSPQDLVTSLGIYMPNLNILSVENIFPIPAQNNVLITANGPISITAKRADLIKREYAGHFVDLVRKAIKESQAYGHAALTSVSYHGALTANKKTQLKFRTVTAHEANVFPALGILVFTLDQQSSYVCMANDSDMEMEDDMSVTDE
ncbi:hypothetical protein CPB97_001442 [Podila verticillata]|nr:hypothetical protein CPB97_001442 [Podila verticillata]